MIEEIWKDIPGYEQYYQASTFGRIRSKDRSFKLHHGAIATRKGKILKGTPDEKGYLKTRLLITGVSFKPKRIHRLIAQTFIPNPLQYSQVNHKNGDKSDNRIENLEWCNNSENQLHANATGLRKGSPSGARNHFSKIVLHLSAGVFYDSARDAYNHSGKDISFEMFCKNIRNNKNYTYGF